ncbi:MAG: sigma-70 family RNA polymerase sigma factor [Planctomycetota bacterium]
MTSPRLNTARPRPALPAARWTDKIGALDFLATLNRARASDARACNDLVEAFYPKVRAMVQRELDLDLRRGRPWLGSVLSTGDILHDVFLGVLRDLDNFHGTEARAFEAYLAGAVSHRLVDVLRFHQAHRRDPRRARSHFDLEATLRDADLTSPTQAAARSEETTAVHTALAELAERDRELLALRFRREAPYQEIARTFDFPSAEAARKAVRTARARLLIRLRRLGVKA